MTSASEDAGTLPSIVTTADDSLYSSTQTTSTPAQKHYKQLSMLSDDSMQLWSSDHIECATST